MLTCQAVTDALSWLPLVLALALLGDVALIVGGGYILTRRNNRTTQGE